MSVTLKVLVPALTVSSSQTTQYTAATPWVLIDKFTATNYSSSPASLSVNLVASGGSAMNDNLITAERLLQPNETYTFPELVGQILTLGQFISTIASLPNSINMRVSGREIT